MFLFLQYVSVLGREDGVMQEGGRVKEGEQTDEEFEQKQPLLKLSPQL